MTFYICQFQWLRKIRSAVEGNESLYNITQACKKKVEWTLHVSILPLWILSRWIRIRSQNFPWAPQFSPSLGEMREILEIAVSVKAILVYAILNKTIMFSRMSSRLVRISMYNFPRIPQNSISLGEKVLSWAKFAISGRFYFCARKLIYFRILSSWIHIWRKKCFTVLQNFPSLGKMCNDKRSLQFLVAFLLYGEAYVFSSFE